MYDPDAVDDHLPDDVALRAVPDLGGLPVEDATGLTVGELFGALAEADTGLVRYVDLSLASLDRHVLVPIGHARVREQERDGPRIRLRAAMLEDLEQIPPFPADVAHVDDPFERALLEAYGRTFHGERYYAHPSYDHDGVYAGDHPVEMTDDAAAGPPPGGEVAGGQALATSSPDACADTGQPGGAGDGSNGSNGGPLRRLAYMPGWKVVRGEPDIRRWPVVLDDNTRGTVLDLIVEPAAGRVRYAAVRPPSGKGDRLLPVGFLQVDAGDRTVRAPGLRADDLHALPEYDGGGVSREFEEQLCGVLRRRLSGRRRYHLPDFRQQPGLPGG